MCRAAVVSCLSVVIVRSDIHCVRVLRALLNIGDDRYGCRSVEVWFGF